jgi:hypothetical protein
MLGHALLEKSKQRVADRIRRENELGLRWVVKLVDDGMDASALAAEYGFRNDGPVRDLESSYVFTVLPAFEATAKEKVDQLITSNKISTYVPFHPDRIKERIAEELRQLEQQDPASAEEYKKNFEDRQQQAQQAASAQMLDQVQQVLGEHANIKAALQQQQQQSSHKPPARKGRNNEWVVLLESGSNANDIAAQTGFINMGEVIGSTINNNYIFKMADNFAADPVIKQQTLSQLQRHPQVLDTLSFNLEDLKKKREELLRQQNQPQQQQQLQQLQGMCLQ